MKGLKTYFTYLHRNKLFTLVNVAGLGISLMFVLLIANMKGAAAHCGQRYKGHRAYLCVVERGI